MRFRIFTILIMLPVISAAQSPGRPARNGGPLTIQQQVAPSFKVSPLVIQAESRRGKTVALKYTLESAARPTRVQVAIVALRQLESGVIMPDESAVPPGVVRIDGSTDFVLNADEVRVITGEIRVPMTETTFLSYGVVVRDLGVEQENVATDNNGEARVRLKFVTQYLCRADITVQGGRAAEASRLLIEDGKLLSSEGLPLASVYVTNPTESPIEFEARCRLTMKNSTVKRKSVAMVMPARANVENEQRYIGRILPGSRVRMEALLPDAVFTGEYDLYTELLSRGRRLQDHQTFVTVQEGDFPAMSVSAVSAAPGIYASPAQIELSMQSGGDRVKNITLTNENEDPVVIRLVPTDHDGKPIQWLSARPSEITLPSGASRKVSITQSTPREQPENLYGFVSVEVVNRNLDGIEGSGKIAAAVICRQSPPPSLNIEDMRFDLTGKHPSFVVTVLNSGRVHAPIHGRLTLMSEEGQLLELNSGFGRWLMPSESTDLTFPVVSPPESGSYQLQTEIRFSNTVPSLSRMDRVNLQFTRTADAERISPQ